MVLIAFFSLKDTVTPTKIAAVSLVLNIIFNVALIFPLKIAGIALATSLSGIITFFILFSLLEKKIGYFGRKETKLCMRRICKILSMHVAKRFKALTSRPELRIDKQIELDMPYLPARL